MLSPVQASIGSAIQHFPIDRSPRQESLDVLSPQAKKIHLESSLTKEPKSSELLIFLAPGVNPMQFGAEFGLNPLHGLKSDPSIWVFEAGNPLLAEAKVQQLTRDSRIRAVYPNNRTQFERTAFAPDDPYFTYQWHLDNSSGYPHIRVIPVWDRDITGAGVTIGFVDDCLEINHPDLSPNYVATDSWDFGQNDSDPSPVYNNDKHGVATSGIAAARGGNGIGMTGIAPLAGLAGLRIDFPNQTDAMFVDATLYHSSGTNTNIGVKNHSYGVSYPYVPTPAEELALETSYTAGTIHIFSAGNDRYLEGEDSNKKDLQNSPAAITVAALGPDGKYAYYSCFGANVFMTAPSGGPWELPWIYTTDRIGEDYGYNGSGDSFPDPDYTSEFGGTSASAPVVAGVMALCKQVQPRLDCRFAKHLLVRTCRIVDPDDTSETSDGGWKTNAAGFKFNQNYGFGLIDAEALVQLACQYTGVTPLTTESTGVVTIGKPIPDEDPFGVLVTFDINSTIPLEEVLVKLDITHTYRGDLEALLTSPSGTTSRLMTACIEDYENDLIWTFLTNTFWGENPCGTWTLKIRDRFSADTGTWNSFEVMIRMGELIANTSPLNYSLSPTGSCFPVESLATITCVYSDTAGYDNLNECQLLVDETLNETNTAYLMYNENSNLLYVMNDAGTAWVGGNTPGSAAVIENSYCRLYCANTTVGRSGNTLTVTWAIEFKSPMYGKICGAWMYCSDDCGLTDGWDRLGTYGFSWWAHWSATQNGNILEIGYGSGTNFLQYAALHLNSSYFRMNYGPESGWGTSVVIMPSFWESGEYYQGAPITYECAVENDNFIITIRGSLLNLHASGKICIFPPSGNSIVAEVSMNTTGDLNLDNRPGEAFKPLMLSSMHISTEMWDAESAFVSMQSFTIPASGWIISPSITGKVLGLKGGTSTWKTNAPTIKITLIESMPITGWVQPSSNPNDDNVGF